MSNDLYMYTSEEYIYEDKKYYLITCGINEISTLPIPKSRIALVIDNSGSMGSNASLPNATEKTNLSVLDIVKHTCKTVIDTLNDEDELCIIKYSDKATKVLSLTKMNTHGKLLANNAIDTINPEGMTNIYDGLKMANDMLKEQTDNNYNTSILLLSDGVPNIEPPKGTFLQFKKDIEDSQTDIHLINTFGFGYSVEVNVLKNIASLSNGSFNFIPDSNFVGTVIVNSLANTMCNKFKNTILSFELENQNYNFLGNYDIKQTSWGFSVNVGFLKVGQPVHFILECDNDNKLLSNSMTCTNIINNEINTIDTTLVDTNVTETMLHYFRLKIVDLISTILELSKNNKYKDAHHMIDIMIQNIEAFINSQSSILLQSSNALQSTSLLQLKGLYEDINGQISEAVESSTTFKKWGEKYLNSLHSAHKLEICNNFKDAGVQFYGGTLFNSLQESFEKIFLSIPPPVARVSTSSYTRSYSSSYSAPVVATPVDMNRFYDRGGSCFHGSCLVLMKDKTTKLLNMLKKGDETFTGIVECIVRTKCLNNEMQYCETDTGLKVTKYHPIKINNKFIFPVDHYNYNIYESNFMYSVVMQKVNYIRPSTIVINDIECITLGHGILNDSIAEHEFFGTEKVINSLKSSKNWSSGLITFNSGLELFKRDFDTNKVIDINLELFYFYYF